jgi:rod shape determining protein RodA
MAAIAILGVLSLYGFMIATGSTDYRLARIAGWLNPDLYSTSDAYQQTQSKMVIGSGSVSGIGMFVNGSMAQLNYVPADWTDFIFATIGEAWGFVGCAGVVVLYLLMILRMLWLARYTRDRFGMLIIIGVTGMFTFHIIENIGMTTGLLPITGIPLPFLSYGGSNFISNIAAIALVLNIARSGNTAAVTTIPMPKINTVR